jgi:hypothetical protein
VMRTSHGKKKSKIYWQRETDLTSDTIVIVLIINCVAMVQLCRLRAVKSA